MATDLLLITPGFPANEGDSTCIPPLQVYLRALRKSRPELRIAVITTQYPNDDRSYQWHGITVHPCNGRNKWYWKARTWRRAGNVFEKARADGGVGTIHSLWLGECAMLGSRFAKSAGGRHVLTLMGQDARDGKSWWRRTQRPSAVVCLTERHAAYFADMSDATADAILPWGIDRQSLATPASQRDIDLLWCGSFAAVKRPDLFLSVIDQFPADKDLRAVMIGQGATPFSEHHRNSFGGLVQQGVLTVLEALPRAEVLKLMQRSKILVHTSAYESQGYVFDEALINGMSIVSGEVGPAQPNARWRIANDAVSMAHAVRDLLRDMPAHDPIILHQVDATMNEYLRLYGLS